MISYGTRLGAVALLVGVLGGCAQPGQLGHPVEAPTPAPEQETAPVAVPSPVPTAPPLVSSGLVEGGVSMRSSGPAQYSVRTVVLAPGESTGWHRHPGQELVLVSSGEIAVQRDDECAPARYAAGEGVFVPDREAHLMRNDGPLPAELVVSRLLTPGMRDEEDVPPAC